MKGLNWISWVGIVCVLGAAAMWMPLVEHHSEVDRATGSVRFRTVRLGIFEQKSGQRPGWIELRAKELGIAYTSDWHMIGHGTQTCLGYMCALGGHRDVPERLQMMENEDPAERDAFLRRYLAANAEGREAMIRKVEEK